MGQPAIGRRFDRIVSDRVVTALALISVVVGFALIGLAAIIMIEPQTEFGMYAISTALFLVVVVIIVAVITRRRPRVSARYS